MSEPTRILVVEDEPAIADAVSYALTSAGFTVEVAADGESALDADIGRFQLVVLDLMLPRISGLEVCRQLRATSGVPVLILTARTGEADRVLGLELGADDYLGKPFFVPELVGRVRALLRRRELDRREQRGVQRLDGLRIDLVEQSVFVDGRVVELTRIEFRLLALLAGQPGRAFTRREIIQHLWRTNHQGGERACDVHVRNLRRKIERDPAHPERLMTVRGVGYLLRAA